MGVAKTNNQIQVLSDAVINQIAAGEVIEHPASVVKELVDNAIDAGSDEVKVEITQGGRHIIRITDNGGGMSPDDALLSLERHATSKLSSMDDLNEIATMGFRGEAVPSIASISKFSIHTHHRESGQSSLVLVEGGQLLQHGEAVRDPGTSIEVKEIFYNLPVRKKFQKSPSFDKNEIQRVVQKFALAHPEISFELTADGKEILNVKKREGKLIDALQMRGQDILGEEWFHSCKPVQYEVDQMKVIGWVGLPSFNRPTRAQQYLFVHRRAIFSPLISRAVLEGYGTTIPTGRFPVFHLHVDIDRHFVDVNVHPQKKEVRFHAAENIKKTVRDAVSEALHQDPVMMEYPEGDVPSLRVMEEPIQTWTFESSMPWEAESSPPLEVREEQETFTFSLTPKVLWTIPGFWFVEVFSDQESHLTLVDQKKAHHRILFEQLSQNEETPSQQLMTPYSFDCLEEEAERLEEKCEELKKRGFQCSRTGKTTISIETVPVGCSTVGIEHWVFEFLDDLNESIEVAHSKVAEKASVSVNQRLPVYEAVELLRQLMSCQCRDHCPKGNPIAVKILEKDLMKWMKEGERECFKTE